MNTHHVQIVETFGRYEIEILGLVRELPDVVVRPLGTTVIRNFARKERNVFVKPDILDEAVIDFLDLVGPIAVALIGFTLMEDDTLDDAVLLRLLGHFDQTLVGVAAIVLDDILKPASLCRHITIV